VSGRNISGHPTQKAVSVIKVSAGRKQGSLESVPLFADLSPDELRSIEAACAWRHFEEGEDIVAYLDKSDDVYFVVSGKARVVIYAASGKVVGFRDLLPGDMFGEYAAIDQGPRSASIEAHAACQVAVMSSAAFQALMRDQPAVCLALIRHLTKQLRSLTNRVYEFSTLAVNNRIQAELLRLAREAGSSDEIETTTAIISPAPTHVEIAGRISSHREAVSRELSRLTKQGLIERQGRSLLVKDMARLERMVRTATGE
jgi:CRP-like cAMP-binding protein